MERSILIKFIFIPNSDKFAENNFDIIFYARTLQKSVTKFIANDDNLCCQYEFVSVEQEKSVKSRESINNGEQETL